MHMIWIREAPPLRHVVDQQASFLQVVEAEIASRSSAGQPPTHEQLHQVSTHMRELHMAACKLRRLRKMDDSLREDVRKHHTGLDRGSVHRVLSTWHPWGNYDNRPERNPPRGYKPTADFVFSAAADPDYLEENEVGVDHVVVAYPGPHTDLPCCLPDSKLIAIVMGAVLICRGVFGSSYLSHTGPTLDKR